MSPISNLVAFQAGWLACVLSAAHQVPWLGTLIALAAVCFHLSRVAHPREEWTLVSLSALAGLVFDSALVALGLIHYASGTLVANLAPHWILAMWMIFATTLNVTFRWLRRRWLSAAALGASLAPLAYYGGSRLGAASFPAGPGRALLGVAIVWAIAMPLLLMLAERYDGIRGAEAPGRSP